MPPINENARLNDLFGQGKLKTARRRFSANAQLLERGLTVQELISSKPGFLLRWGVTIFLCILMAVVAITWFIQYPDVVVAKARLTSSDPPTEIISKFGGQLLKLFKKEGDSVHKNEVIGYMESNSNPEKVLHLSVALNNLQNNLTTDPVNNISSDIFVPKNDLGELQPFYQSFIQSVMLFRNYLGSGFFIRKRRMLLKDMLNLQRINNNLSEQKNIDQQDLGLTEKTFLANEQLRRDSVISDFEYRTERSKLLAKKMSLPQISSAIIGNEDQQNQKQKEIFELESQISEQRSVFVQALNTFISHVEEWKKKYLIASPVEGVIHFSGTLEEHQQLRPNQLICFVSPSTSRYYAEMYIPQFNLGKVRLGQPVLLKFPAYPYQEYGSMRGNIEFISTMPTDTGYLAKVSLPPDLTTDYTEQIQYREGLWAQGEIITKKIRLLERFYYNIIKEIRK
jgi:multidrug efflux pump subunit AcrA (membrane-fusion protein)